MTIHLFFVFMKPRISLQIFSIAFPNPALYARSAYFVTALCKRTSSFLETQLKTDLTLMPQKQLCSMEHIFLLNVLCHECKELLLQCLRNLQSIV